MTNKTWPKTGILPCPFCGGEPEVWGSGEQERGMMIHCVAENCPNPSVSYYQHEAAKRVWNRRDGKQTVNEQIDKLLKELREEKAARQQQSR